VSPEKKADEERLSPLAHWLYMAGVLGGGFVLNLILIAILGASGG
jgi:hypothetical protein